MFWPVIPIVLLATMKPSAIGLDADRKDGFATKQECEAAPGCVDIPPLEFYERHIKAPDPAPEYRGSSRVLTGSGESRGLFRLSGEPGYGDDNQQADDESDQTPLIPKPHGRWPSHDVV